MEAFEMKVYGVGWRRSVEQSTYISNEMLKLVEEERSLLTIIRTRQRNWMGHNYNDRVLTSKRNNRRKNGL